MTSVVVVMPIGTYSIARCAVDQFTPGELTVTSQYDDAIVRVFHDGEWLHATAYREGTDEPDYWFVSRLVQERAKAAAHVAQAHQAVA